MEKNLEARLKTIAERYRGKLAARHANESIKLALGTGATSVGALLSALNDQDAGTRIRLHICWVLGQLDDKRAVTSLLKAFHDGKELRWEAAKSLGLIRSKRAVEPLIDVLLHSTTADKRAAAAYALGHLCDLRSARVLRSVLQTDQAPKVRGYAAEALCYLRDRGAVTSLIRSLDDRSPEVRFWSAFALGELGDARALPKLKHLARSDTGTLKRLGSVSKEASKAIERIRTSVVSSAE